jgi:hypothetical protein
MGDFDKKQSSSAADAAAREKKKLLLVGVLGAAFLGVIFYQFTRSGPQTAKAFGGTEAPSSIEPVQLSPREALAGLDPSHDPTAKLLLGTSELPTHLVQVPRNPFKLSDDMRNQLVKAPDPVKPEPVKPVQTRIVVTQRNAPTANTDGLKLQGIFTQGDKRFASINGNIVTAGNAIGKVRIVEIRDDQVLVRHADYPGGPITALNLKN